MQVKKVHIARTILGQRDKNAKEFKNAFIHSYTNHIFEVPITSLSIRKEDNAEIVETYDDIKFVGVFADIMQFMGYSISDRHRYTISIWF